MVLSSENNGLRGLKLYPYIRVSWADRKRQIKTHLGLRGQNPDMQWNDISEWAHNEGIELVGKYSDVDTGSNPMRLDYVRLLKDITLGDDGITLNSADGVVAWDLDRLSRDVEDFAHLLKVLRTHNKRLFGWLQEPKEVNLNDPDEVLLAHIRSALAERERAKGIIRIKAGIREYKREHGRWGMEKVPVDEARLIELRKQGISLRGIASMLDVSHVTIKKRLKELGMD